jgi:D-tyrosyl-tRNA(Tyr) deacylase
MRAVVQRVGPASVTVGGELVGAIERGLLVFLGIHKEDTQEELLWLSGKLVKLRVFDDAEGKMNLGILDLPDASALVISQFTLFGTIRKGTRPSYNRAAPPVLAVPLYEAFARELAGQLGRPVPTGRFGEHMDINACQDGPVTLILDTRERDF